VSALDRSGIDLFSAIALIRHRFTRETRPHGRDCAEQVDGEAINAT
jgi:hypothetical protein